mmetsp:Transcript_79333/g.220680  ORF Transcript_79333/g.220680 Transcript_79333/m.220680 type:complete len:211 (+) Transcript_79333:1247-1879(+)
MHHRQDRRRGLSANTDEALVIRGVVALYYAVPQNTNLQARPVGVAMALCGVPVAEPLAIVVREMLIRVWRPRSVLPLLMVAIVPIRSLCAAPAPVHAHTMPSEHMVFVTLHRHLQATDVGYAGDLDLSAGIDLGHRRAGGSGHWRVLRAGCVGERWEGELHRAFRRDACGGALQPPIDRSPNAWRWWLVAVLDPPHEPGPSGNASAIFPR